MAEIAQIVAPLLTRMSATRKFRNFPRDYLVVDIETTGVELGLDLIVQIGHCVVIDGKPVDRVATLLDWSRVPAIDSRWLSDRLARVKRHVETDKQGQPTGKKYHITYDRLTQDGVEPVAVLNVYRDWFDHVRADNMFFVSHNGIKFDGPFLNEAFTRWLDKPFIFDPLEMLDTGMVEKALRANELPWPEETAANFYSRVGAMRLKGVRWALDAFAIPQHGLDVKHGLDLSAAHSADFDCYMCHLLFEHYLEKTAALQPAKEATNG